jgi:hypothetical protein
MLATFSTVLLKVTEMTTTLQVQAQQTIADSILKNTYLLIEALKDNYREYAINGHKNSIRRAKRGENVDYHLVRIKELKNGDCSIDYQVETGKKYHKVVFIDGGGSRSVHAFIDKQTGEIYKSASWKAPAKGVRYDLRLIADREYLLQNADWSGGYLYAR